MEADRESFPSSIREVDACHAARCNASVLEYTGPQEDKSNAGPGPARALARTLAQALAQAPARALLALARTLARTKKNLEPTKKCKNLQNLSEPAKTNKNTEMIPELGSQTIV